MVQLIDELGEEQLEFDVESDLAEKAARIEAERSELVAAVTASQFDTLHRRVAWVLNYYPDARDSDITLQIQYWENFEEIDTSGGIFPSDLYKLTRLTSLARARAKIQNTYQLFLATPAVRKQRGKLAEEDRERLAEATRPSAPVYAVYLDESGKNETNLIIASVWVLHPPEIVRLLNEIQRWRKERKVEKEFHFKDINESTLDLYKSFIDFILDNAAVLTFRAIAADNRGNKNIDDTIEKLIYHLLLRSVEHEHGQGRATLPRTLIVTKDEDAPGRDKLMLAEIADQLRTASSAQLAGRLEVGAFETVKSELHPIVQIADLFAGSLNRVLNVADNAAAKDRFAHHLLNKLGIPRGPSSSETAGDIAVVISL
jgi:hypothetical protein